MSGAIEVEGLEMASVRVFYPIWKQPWIAINRATYVRDVLAIYRRLTASFSVDASGSLVARGERS